MNEGIVYLILMGIIGLATFIQNYNKESKKQQERNKGIPPQPNGTSPFSRPNQSQPVNRPTTNTTPQNTESSTPRPFSRQTPVQPRESITTSYSNNYTSSLSQSIGGGSGISGSIDFSEEGVSALSDYVEMQSMEEMEKKAELQSEGLNLDFQNQDEVKKAIVASMIFDRKY